MTTRFLHKSVLLRESIDGLNIQPGDIYLDGTLGSGGHAIAAVEAAMGKVTVIGLDRDGAALKRTAARFNEMHLVGEQLILRQANYRDLDKVLDELGIPLVNRIMLDLGLSSDQLETSRRGFSFKDREPLLMTFDHNEEHGPDNVGHLTAKEIVNEWEEENLADVIYGYGEERYSRRIAKAIVEARAHQPIRTTHELVEIVTNALPVWAKSRPGRGKINPATKTFQALRIAVNDELNALKEGLVKGFSRLTPGGRMAIISFHSLEDRLVKNFYKDKEKTGQGKLITKKPIAPGPEEISENPRSRSSKLRIIEKIIS